MYVIFFAAVTNAVVFPGGQSCLCVCVRGLPRGLSTHLSSKHAYTCVCACVFVCVCDSSTSTEKLPEKVGGRGAEESETEVDRKRLLMGSFKLKRIRP